MSTASSAAPSRVAQVGRKSVSRLREFVRTGGLSALAEVDPLTGEVLDTEARALFGSLPTITPATSAEELMGHGLITEAPANIHLAYETPKYRVGRELFVRTSVSHASEGPNRPVGGFAQGAPVSFTHRAVLRGQRGEDFMVELSGTSGLFAFSRTDVYSWNEPCVVPSSGGSISGVQIDYNDPRWKAYICAGFILVADEIARLDFSDSVEKVRKQQEEILYRLASQVKMDYVGRGEGYAGPRAGSLIDGGQGVSFVQRAVTAAYLQVFAKVLAFELQIAVGRTLRLGSPHGFVVITLRPSLCRYVSDPAWNEPLTDLPVAFFGPRWGHNRRLEGFEGSQELIVRPVEVDVPLMEAAS